MATTTHDEVRLGAQGRLVIPAKLRKALGFKPGDQLIARQEDDRLVLEKADAIERGLRALFAHIPPDVSLADELIAERREEAKREEEQ